MEFTHSRTVKATALLVLLAAMTQISYEGLAKFMPDLGRKGLWKIEGLLFVLMAAFAGAAMSGSKRYKLVFSAIAFSAVLNVIQVGVGLTQFGVLNKAVAVVPELKPAGFSFVAFSFFGYNAAKVLLGLAAIVIGLSKLASGNKVLGAAAVLVGLVAFFANSIVMMFGIGNEFIPRSLAGGTGVAATFILAICLFTVSRED